jgi:hypothetical protein
MGSVPGHPLLDLCLDEIKPRASYGMQLGAGSANDKDETGPGFLDRMLLDRPEPRFIEPELFYPRTSDEQEQAYAVHHRARAWKDAEGLRRSLAKADKRLLKAEQAAREWQLKYEQAEAELSRLRGR